MNWDDIRLFLAVSRAGLLKDAAARLGVDEATLSRRIRRLERDMDARLFERTRRGHQLTKQGEELLAHAEIMEQAGLAAAETVAGQQGAVVGTVRLSVAEGFGSRFVAPSINKLMKAYPGLELDLVAGTGVLSPSKREADIAVGLSRPRGGQIFVRKLTDYRLRLYGASSFFARHHLVKVRDDLDGLPLIGYVDDLIFAPELRYTDDALPGQRPQLRSTSINAQYEMVRTGNGLAILPDFMVKPGDGLLPVLEDEIVVTRSFWLSVHQDIRTLPRVRAVIDFLDGLVKGGAVNQT
ncbi:MAG: LysR family transcriptional regulator [Alphaproteobacteria bacterium]